MTEEKKTESGATPDLSVVPSRVDLGEYDQTASRQYGSVEPYVFSNPERASHWQRIYEKTIYLVCFLAAEFPGGLISKKIRPDRYTPAAIMIWGALCDAQSATHDRTSFWAFSAVLGFVQGGFIPEMILYLSYYYKGNELLIRLSVFWTAIPLTQTYGTLLAAGILQMHGIQGRGGWQWLFLIEGQLAVVYNMCYQVGSIIAVNIYRDDDKPYYYWGNRIFTGLCAANIALFVGMKLFYIWCSKNKTKTLDDIPTEERKHVVVN